MKVFQSIQRILATMPCSQNQQARNEKRSNSTHGGKETELKVLQTIRKNFAAMGFTPNQQRNNQWWQLSCGQIVAVFICSINSTSIGLYVFREADRLDEYIDSGFPLTATIASTIIFISIILKNDELFDLIEFSAEEENFSTSANIFFYFLDFVNDKTAFSLQDQKIIQQHEQCTRKIIDLSKT